MTIVDRDVIVDGVRLAYRDSGDGEPVVFLHGTPSHSVIWRQVIPAVEEAGNRVLAYDLLGYGRSERPPGRDTSVAAQAALLEELLDARALERVNLVAHDIGGAVAMILALRHPQRVARLALIDTVSYDSWPSASWQEIIRSHFDAYERMPAADFRAMMTRQLRMTVYHKERMSGDLLERYLEPLSGPLGKASFFAYQVAHYDSRYTEEISDQLAELAMPVLILWGGEDEWQPVSYARRLAADIPGAELVVVPGAGHFLMEDAPRGVTAELTRFLSLR